MPQYSITEQPNGDFLIHFPDGDKLLPARRDRTDAMPAIAVDGSRYSTHWQPDMFQVLCVTYRREDGAAVHGPYLGQCFALTDAVEPPPGSHAAPRHARRKTMESYVLEQTHTHTWHHSDLAQEYARCAPTDDPQRWEAIPLTHEGSRTEPRIEILYLATIQRAALACGADADWTDATSAQDALERYLGLYDKAMLH